MHKLPLIFAISPRKTTGASPVARRGAQMKPASVMKYLGASCRSHADFLQQEGIHDPRGVAEVLSRGGECAQGLPAVICAGTPMHPIIAVVSSDTTLIAQASNDGSGFTVSATPTDGHRLGAWLENLMRGNNQQQAQSLRQIPNPRVSAEVSIARPVDVSAQGLLASRMVLAAANKQNDLQQTWKTSGHQLSALQGRAMLDAVQAVVNQRVIPLDPQTEQWLSDQLRGVSGGFSTPGTLEPPEPAQDQEIATFLEERLGHTESDLPCYRGAQNSTDAAAELTRWLRVYPGPKDGVLQLRRSDTHGVCATVAYRSSDGTAAVANLPLSQQQLRTLARGPDALSKICAHAEERMFEQVPGLRLTPLGRRPASRGVPAPTPKHRR